MEEFAIWSKLIGPTIERASYVAAFCESIAILFLYRFLKKAWNDRDADRVSFDEKQKGWIKSGLDLALIVEKNTAATREGNELAKKQADDLKEIKITLANISRERAERDGRV